MILTVDIPDELLPYLNAAAMTAGEPDLPSAVSAHLATLIRDNAQRSIQSTALAAVTDQVVQGLAQVDAQNALIAVTTAPNPATTASHATTGGTA